MLEDRRRGTEPTILKDGTGKSPGEAYRMVRKNQMHFSCLIFKPKFRRNRVNALPVVEI
jgi:hypothetical protein